MYNIQNQNTPATNYQSGLLPQRNHINYWYSDTSCRSNLHHFQLSSENRRILRKTNDFCFTTSLLPQSPTKEIFNWVKQLGWEFPTSSIKTVFNSHIFNILYTWSYHQQPCAYSICYFNQKISHVAYVFYHPTFAHRDLPIRLTLQVIIDSQARHFDYCYLGRDHTSPTGHYKRNMPGYEYYHDGNWLQYK